MERAFRALDWVCIGFVLLGACGHTAGALATYPAGSEILVYALGMSILALLCGLASILRARRASDHGVAWLALLAAAGQAGVALAWGFAIRSPLDPRVIGFVLAAGGLIAFSAAALRRPAGAAAPPGAIAGRSMGL